jgi:hypothetical protein
VDYEFINAHPSPGATGLWANTYINGAVQGPEKVTLVTDATAEYRWAAGGCWCDACCELGSCWAAAGQLL